MANGNEYTELIAGAHVGKEKFAEFVYQMTEPLRIARERLAGLRADFDIDYAVGKQLDAVGVRVGFSRRLSLPMGGVYFAFDDDGGKGFDLGIWFEPKMSAYGITELPDDIYRRCLRMKVALNHYSGTNESMEALFQKILDAFEITGQSLSYYDGQDMTVQIGVASGGVPPAVYQVIRNRLLPFNHAGVGVSVSSEVLAQLATAAGDLLANDDGDILALEYS